MAVEGGLFVYAPVAATPECIRLVKGLESTHGPVKYILLPSKAVEHKVLTPPFAQAFPDAGLFVAPGQFSVPVDLPLSVLGFPPYQVIDPSKLGSLPWSSDCDTAALDIGTFGEVAIFHRRSQSLVLTDSIVRVSEDPPSLLLDSEYKKALAYHAHDDDDAVPLDSVEVRRRGWARIALFANFFNPGAISDQKVAVPETGGSRPWQWQPGWEASFARLRNEGRPFVAPIIRELILKQQPESAKAYVSQLASWNFKRVVSAHFDCPIELSPNELPAIFSFLDEGADSLGYCAEDVAFISDLQKSAIPNGRPVPAAPFCGYTPRS